MKKNFTEIEEIIETRIAQLSEEYDLDRYDIEDIRLEAYQENGWSCDPFPLEDGDEEEDGWDDFATGAGNPSHARGQAHVAIPHPGEHKGPVRRPPLRTD